jgi:hypothetical protein
MRGKNAFITALITREVKNFTKMSFSHNKRVFFCTRSVVVPSLEDFEFYNVAKVICD